MACSRKVREWNKPIEKESSKAFAAFCVYRDLGPTRSTAKTAENLRKTFAKPSPSQRWLQVWASRFNWLERAKAYDVHQLEKHRLEVEAKFAKRRLEVKAENLSYLEHTKKVIVGLIDSLRECSNPDKTLDRLSDIMDAFRWILDRERIELGMTDGDIDDGSASASIRASGDIVSIEAKLDRIARRRNRRTHGEGVSANPAPKSAFGDD
ncbi:hypothetical protein HYR99_09055 [Candidatus Poribacteria bacterium]|nr:hypothetical protein [Candidatus Poribacteria bacterium]